jgi:hypothetical protein
MLFVFLLVIPLAAWALFKPVRVISPVLAGVTCISEYICTDDISHYQAASSLYDDALNFVDSNIDTINYKPRIIFCTTDNCFHTFGFGKQSAATVGTFGIVIGPHAWKQFYVRHEMIHHLQGEKLGLLKFWKEPSWFIEGMAYSLSKDPRPQLAEPWQQYREHFNQWYGEIRKENLWSEARQL